MIFGAGPRSAADAASLLTMIGDVIDAKGKFPGIVNRGLNLAKPIIQGPHLLGQPHTGGGGVVPFQPKPTPGQQYDTAIRAQRGYGSPESPKYPQFVTMKPGMPGYDPKMGGREYSAHIDTLPGGSQYRPPSANDTAQTSYAPPGRPTASELSEITRNAKAQSKIYKQTQQMRGMIPPDYRMPLAEKQAAEAKTLMSLKQGNQAWANKWSAWAHSAGMNTNKALEAIRTFGQNRSSVPSDNEIKYMLTTLRQRGEL